MNTTVILVAVAVLVAVDIIITYALYRNTEIDSKIIFEAVADLRRASIKAFNGVQDNKHSMCRLFERIEEVEFQIKNQDAKRKSRKVKSNEDKT